MGLEGKLYWGAAGGTASTELTIARDVGYRFEPTEADVSDRASIVELTDVAMVKFALDFEDRRLIRHGEGIVFYYGR
jgi:hypothetical protein